MKKILLSILTFWLFSLIMLLIVPNIGAYLFLASSGTTVFFFVVYLVIEIYTNLTCKRIQYLIKSNCEVNQLRVTYNELAKLYELKFYNFFEYKRINKYLATNNKLKAKTYLKYKEDF